MTVWHCRCVVRVHMYKGILSTTATTTAGSDVRATSGRYALLSNVRTSYYTYAQIVLTTMLFLLLRTVFYAHA